MKKRQSGEKLAICFSRLNDESVNTGQAVIVNYISTVVVVVVVVDIVKVKTKKIFQLMSLNELIESLYATSYLAAIFVTILDLFTVEMI